MRKFIVFTAVSAAVSLSAAPALAGGWGGGSGWGKGGHVASSGGLLNVSPSIQTGNLNLLSGIGILNNSPILSGNVLSGIVSGKSNNVGQGNVGGRQNAVGNGLIGGGSFGNSATRIHKSSSYGGKRW